MNAFLDGFVHQGVHTTGEGFLGIIGEASAKLINDKFPYKTPEMNDLFELYLKSFLTSKDFQTYAKREGYSFLGLFDGKTDFYQLNKDKVLEFDPIIIGKKDRINNLWLQSKIWFPEPEMILQWLNRGWITEAVADKWLTWHGIISKDLRKTFTNLKDEYPSVQDLIQFSVRHGFEPDILKTFGYTQEIPKTFMTWAKAIGLGGSSKVTIDDATDSDGNAIPSHEATWAEQHWFAHWILPSLGDAYEFLHRLYDKSDYGPSPDWKPDLTFNAELLSLFQRAQDIPKYWRGRLQAISYLPLSRVDVRRMYQQDIIDDAGVYHSYRAQGYNDDNAKKLLKFAKHDKQIAIYSEEGLPKAKELCKFYNLGILTRDEMKGYLDKLKIPGANVDDIIQNCDLEKKHDTITAVMKAVKRAFLKGIADEGDVRKQLSSLGVSDDSLSDIILQWTLEREFEFKEDNASQAQKWFEQGIITKEEFVQRLQNLNIQPASIVRMVASTLVTISERIAKEEAKQAKEITSAAKASAKEQKALAKEAEKATKDRIKLLLTSSTQANLKAWFKGGLISDQEVTNRLNMLNWLPEDIDRFLITNAPKG